MNFNAKGWFPTLICDYDCEVHDKFKSLFYNDLGKYISNTLYEGEAANVTFHQNLEFDFLFEDIARGARLYLEALEVDSTRWDFHLTKCWWQTITDNRIPLHTHKEAHLSFVYYVNIPDNHPSDLVLFGHTNSFVNDVANGLFHQDYFNLGGIRTNNFFNSYSVNYKVREGQVILFPGQIPHQTSLINQNSCHEMSFDLEEVKKRRISIAGDFIITHSQTSHTPTGLQPVENWRKF